MSAYQCVQLCHDFCISQFVTTAICTLHNTLQIGIVLPGIKAETTAAPGSAYNSSKTAAAAAAVAALSPRSSGRKKAQTASTSSSGRKGRGKQKAKREEFDSDGDDDGDYPGAEDYDEPYDDEQDTSPSKDEQGVCALICCDTSYVIVTVRSQQL
jgi:hypothetical protein